MDVAITWTSRARRFYGALLSYLKEQPFSHPQARDREIHDSIEKLRRAPCKCAVAHVRAGRQFRRMVVKCRFLVYYVYFPPRGPKGRGRISIRAVKHAARRQPFAGVREPESVQYGARVPLIEPS
jgi:plasmid stabilization system protein ParE